ncbi:tRNA (adenosine(37)-N6)-threonylcarbamoyltransferase complex transferase subunit TsaD [Patescibacteria group bacterium]|nr:tRNA (adenosine(37)-N6)-threonylcarbamoyltransferase complex transferase subunit TsaD [Patescibacteria group bacterium]
MKIFSIETSCDETSAAIVQDGRKVLSNVISSQAQIHAETGGVVPEVAARQHLKNIIPTIDAALKNADFTMKDIDAIAVTNSPGLISSLLIGGVTAETLAAVYDKPLIPVNHVAGHIYAVYLENEEEMAFPRIILTVSGGHNDIYLMKDHFDFELLGSTVDDSAGEAFDKAARLLGLGYPGGPVIEKEARDGHGGRFNLPRPMLNDESLNMSFSGLKTALLYKIQNMIKAAPVKNDRFKKIDRQDICDLALAFQDAVIDVLVTKLGRAADRNNKIKEIHVVGGVSANRALRSRLDQLSTQIGVKVRYPSNLVYCTDNAAMIGAAAYFQAKKWPEKLNDYKLELRANSGLMAV